MKANFVNEIKNKLALKGNGKQGEETLLVKAFKYFDLDNSGECSRDEWLKALNKIGVTGFNEEKLMDMFNEFDTDKSGQVDYKEFTKAVFNDDEEKEDEGKNKAQNSDEIQQNLKDSKVMDKFRERILERGGKGILGLARQFKIFDDNRSGTLDLPELTKAIKDFKVDLTNNEIKILFNLVDVDGSGEVSYDEFLRQIRGDMPPNRRKLVDQAFSKLDHDKSGVVDMNEIKSLYNAKQHPDVKKGKKTEDEVLTEFMETFQIHASIKGKGVKDTNITREEFQEYYENISCSIDRDDYWELMMTSAWKLGEKASYEGKKAWSNKDEEVPKGLKDSVKNRKNQKGTISQNAPWGVSEGKTDYTTSNNPKAPSLKIGKGGSDLLMKFREGVAKRGCRGIMSLRRSFMIADDNNNKEIDKSEFLKLCKDYRIPVDEKDIPKLFDEFDYDKSGSISYDEFLRSIIGEMNDFRMNLAKRAFKIMDKDKSGVINIDDIRGVYNAKFHPDVKKGKKTEDEVLAEFLDTFEEHFNVLNNNSSKDRNISIEEWIEYYNNISMSIDRDDYFELMIKNAWNMDGQMDVNKKKGWSAEI